ncbi:MAG: hypothetical protein JWM57_3877 [Phycisphaerales bacterium]|nr:hypothetical protein [Phycisphaerales bacterium]
MPVITHWSDRIGGAAARLALSIVVILLTTVAVPHSWSWTLRGLAGWSAGAGTYLFMAWRIMLRADADATRHRCRMDDASRGIVDLLLTVATFASVGAVCLALKDSQNDHGTMKVFGIVLPILATASAWVLVHTLYALHYARLFYINEDDADGPPAGGFDWHDDPKTAPDYRDFLYIAFAIGCTYGVTDTDVNRKVVRRTITKHGILSFVFATIVVALAVNISTNLLFGGN